MHDDTVAQRFGFSGGLVPGVDVLAYMMHLPVAKWGRAFLERGLIEARFVKPVYDGEIAHVTGEDSDGVLSIEVESRGSSARPARHRCRPPRRRLRWRITAKPRR
jgi:acyl dehydratase